MCTISPTARFKVTATASSIHPSSVSYSHVRTLTFMQRFYRCTCGLNHSLKSRASRCNTPIRICNLTICQYIVNIWAQGFYSQSTSCPTLPALPVFASRPLLQQPSLVRCTFFYPVGAAAAAAVDTASLYQPHVTHLHVLSIPYPSCKLYSGGHCKLISMHLAPSNKSVHDHWSVVT